MSVHCIARRNFSFHIVVPWIAKSGFKRTSFVLSSYAAASSKIQQERRVWSVRNSNRIHIVPNASPHFSLLHGSTCNKQIVTSPAFTASWFIGNSGSAHPIRHDIWPAYVAKLGVSVNHSCKPLQLVELQYEAVSRGCGALKALFSEQAVLKLFGTC